MTNHIHNGNRPRGLQAPHGSGQPGAAAHSAPLHPGGYNSPHQGQHDYVDPPQQGAEQYDDLQSQRIAANYGYQSHVAPEHEQPAKFIKHKRRPNRFIRMMQLAMSITFFVAIGLAGFVMFTRYQVDQPGPLTEAAIFEVGKGQGLTTISSRLQNVGIISNKRIFALNAVASKAAKKLKAGKYSIPQAASMQKVLDILVAGKAIYYHITLPEGWTSEQIVNALNAHPQMAGSIEAIPAEGSLMPNTFQFSEGQNRRKLLAKMAVAQKEYLAKKWLERQQNLPLKTPQEALILASIVEKETGRSSERKRVAGVFINRLRKGIKLQSDPTIIYGLVGGKGKLGHPLLRSEMNKKTGFNTYHIAGLPPTPITNPGRLSIEAVLNPADTKDLFFVADGTGGHAFAPNLKLHNENVRNWRKVEAKRRLEQKRKEAEKKRLAALENQQKPKEEKTIPSISLSKPEAISPKNQNGWKNDIPLPVRKPR
jgi:peptidoglycan lytic transglycosylase G